MALPDFPSLLVNSFNDYTYPKNEQFDSLVEKNFDQAFYKKKLTRETGTIRHFMDLLVSIFIQQNIPAGGRILEVGGGNSRGLAYFQKDYECWNIDKLEGLGNGPLDMNRALLSDVKLVRDYMGNFNKALPDEYFDFIFSLAALEVIPGDDPNLFDNIIDDIQRLLKPHKYSLHCLGIVLRKNMTRKSWSNPILQAMFHRTETVNDYIPLEQLENFEDVFCLSETEYERRMRKFTNESYKDFGLMSSYHALWQKPTIQQ